MQRFGTQEQNPKEKGFCTRWEVCAFPGGHIISWLSPVWQSRCYWRKEEDTLAEDVGECSLLHGEEPWRILTHPCCSWAHMAARPQTGSPNPPSPPEKCRFRNPPNCSFPLARRRLGSPEQPAWACRESRILVLGRGSCADTSEQRLLPTGATEAANNPGVPGLRAAQLSASCPFLGGRGATGRVHLLAIIE